MGLRLPQLTIAAVVAAVLYGSSPAEARGRDYVVECGRVRMVVSDRGYLRRIAVGQTGVLGSIGLVAVCGDKSVKGQGRMYQRCTFWEDSQDVAPRGVQIVRDGEQGRVVISREGVLAFGRKGDAKVLAYAQRVEVTIEGKMTVEYQIEFLRTLSWSHQPVSVEMHVPMSLAEGGSCAMDRRPSRAISAVWSKEAQVTGRFQTLQLAGLRVTAGEGTIGSLQDPRAWDSSRRSSHQYVAISRARPWFEGLRPIEKGTTWRIAFTVQLPMTGLPIRTRTEGVTGQAPSRATGRILFEDRFDRAELGPDWLGGTFATSAADRHTKELAASKAKEPSAIRDKALDLRVAGGRGKCTAQTRVHGIPARCALQFDLTLKSDDTIGQTQHSLFLRSHSDPGDCLCLHVDTRRQFFFFEVKHNGRYGGEKLYYYPFAFTMPPRDQTFRFYIESAGDSGLLIWITGEDIPANNMPIAMLGGREWTPFRAGELFFFSGNKEPEAVAHVQWDNIRVSELPARPTLNELYYRNQLLLGFREYLFAPPGSAVEVAVRKTQDGEALAQGAVENLDWETSRLLLDVSKLDKGKYTVTADLIDQVGKQLSRSVLDFHKVRAPKLKLTDMKVHVDEQNRLVVDGKPFFPIGMYCCRGRDRWESDALFAEMASVGFNTVQNYSVIRCSRAQEEEIKAHVIPWLDSAHEHGLRVYLGIAPSTGPVFRRRGRSRDLSDRFGSRIDPLADTAQAMDLLRDHPSVLCWYIGDESIGHGMTEDYMSRLNRLVKHLDPHHPTCIATCPGGHRNDGLRRTARVCDIPANDHYPSEDMGPAWRSTAVKSQDAVDSSQTWWAVPLCCKRPFSENELRVQVYEAIVHGARGIIWWAAYYVKTRFPENWERTKALASELRDLSPILLGDACEDAVRVQPEDATIDWILRKAKGRRYLIVVNYKPAPTDAVSFTVPGISSCRPLFGDSKPLEVRGGRFTHRVEAYGRNVYELQ